MVSKVFSKLVNSVILCFFFPLGNLSLIFLLKDTMDWHSGVKDHLVTMLCFSSSQETLLLNGQVATHDVPNCGRLILPFNSTTFLNNSFLVWTIFSVHKIKENLKSPLW